MDIYTMRTFVSWTILFLFLSLTFLRSAVSQGKWNANVEAFQDRPVGASAKELLDDRAFKSLTVEVQYMPGFKPREETIRNMKAFLNTYLHKPAGISVVMKAIPASPQPTLSLDEAAAIEKQNRTQSVSKERITLYVLFTNGTHPRNEIIGMAYRNTSAVIYSKSIRDNSNPGQVLTRSELETSVLLHEFGHLLGLVNKGSDVISNHVDPANDFHCINKNCLMFHATETKDLSTIQLKGHIPVLDSPCIANLMANGAKTPAGY